MTLNQLPAHPGRLCYVLKLHRDAKTSQGELCGLLEHIATGHSVAFADAKALVAALLAHAAEQSGHADGSA
jgi:hypothetical protein